MDPAKETLYREMDWHPWPTQLEGHESNARFKSIFAGARYGKSRWAAMEVLPDILQAGTRGWIVAPTYSLASKEFAYIYEATVLKMGLKPKRELNARYSTPGPQSLLFTWGSEVHTKSEDNPDSLLGEELDWLILGEGSRLKETTYDTYLRARLGTRLGRVIVPTTPAGYNWLYKRFYTPATEGKPDYFSKIVSVLENALFHRSEYDRAKEELPEEVFREQYDGEFVAYTGLVYRRFRRDRNIVAPFEIPKHWLRYAAIDPHPQTPCAVVWVAIDEHGTWYIYDEMFIKDLTIPEISNRISGKEGKDQIYKRLIDPNAKYVDKLRGQTASVKLQFIREGISCTEADNKFESGWFRINELLTPRPVYGDPDKEQPKMFVFNTCKETINELEGCTWENEKKGTNNHILDALRYIANDTPHRTWKEEEIEEMEDEERSFISSMNPHTGY
jgi:hypothetical protein